MLRPLVDDDETFWWCADETGELHTLATSELRECLEDHSIPSHALVWRAGWSEWAPAARVPELRSVLRVDEHEDGPLPKAGSVGSAPPPPDLTYYASRRARRKPAVLELDLSALGAPRIPRGIDPVPATTPVEPGTLLEHICERPTTRAPEATLPEEAFPEREAFIAHVRARHR